MHSKDLESHIKHLEEILGLLDAADLKIRIEKSDIGRNSLDYLGHHISGDGISPSPKKTAAVLAWPEPRTVKQTQSYLGFTNYYRRYVPRYSKIAAPLYELTTTPKGKPFIWRQVH